MSRPDAQAAAALSGQVIRPVFFCFLDILGDPLRACTAGESFALSGTGDPDLDGHVFLGIDPTVVSISEAVQTDGGADPMTARLSGLQGLDADLLNIVGDPANWLGRTARFWRMIRDADGVQRGALQHYRTGWMTALAITGQPSSQTINLTVQTYLAAYSAASNRTYLDQDQFDPGDRSAEAAIAIVNGLSGNPALSNTPSWPDGGGGGGRLQQDLQLW